jgi:hypothetical protein
MDIVCMELACAWIVALLGQKRVFENNTVAYFLLPYSN